jgi:hypothetical protein
MNAPTSKRMEVSGRDFDLKHLTNGGITLLMGSIEVYDARTTR